MAGEQGIWVEEGDIVKLTRDGSGEEEFALVGPALEGLGLIYFHLAAKPGQSRVSYGFQFNRRDSAGDGRVYIRRPEQRPTYEGGLALHSQIEVIPLQQLPSDRVFPNSGAAAS